MMVVVSSDPRRLPRRPSRLEIPDHKRQSWLSPRSVYGFPDSPRSQESGCSPRHLGCGSASAAMQQPKWIGGAAEKGGAWSYSAAPVSPEAAAVAVVDSCGSGVCGGGTGRDFGAGTFVFVRCNQAKWLLGQVRQVTNAGVRVWIGSAQVLVDVPVGLAATHLTRLGMPIDREFQSPLRCSPSSSCPASPRMETPALNICQQKRVFKHLQIVRPAHLSHRRLYLLLPVEQKAVGRASMTARDSNMPFYSMPEVPNSLNICHPSNACGIIAQKQEFFNEAERQTPISRSDERCFPCRLATREDTRSDHHDLQPETRAHECTPNIRTPQTKGIRPPSSPCATAFASSKQASGSAYPESTTTPLTAYLCLSPQHLTRPYSHDKPVLSLPNSAEYPSDASTAYPPPPRSPHSAPFPSLISIDTPPPLPMLCVYPHSTPSSISPLTGLCWPCKSILKEDYSEQKQLAGFRDNAMPSEREDAFGLLGMQVLLKDKPSIVTRCLSLDGPQGKT